jgi:hypothetical protein
MIVAVHVMMKEDAELMSFDKISFMQTTELVVCSGKNGEGKGEEKGKGKGEGEEKREGEEKGEGYVSFMNRWRPRMALMQNVNKVTIKRPPFGLLSRKAEVDYLQYLPCPNLVTSLVWEGLQWEYHATDIMRLMSFLPQTRKILLKFDANGGIAGVMKRGYQLCLSSRYERPIDL